MQNDQYKNANHHDLGGREEYLTEKICRDDEHIDPEDFGARVDALRVLLGSKKILLTDELRRGVESIPREEYFRMQYYERWLRSITFILVEKGILDQQELK